MMKVNKWTLGLAAVGLISLPAMVQADEKPNQLLTALSSTTISGYVDTSAHWTLGSGNANPPAYSFNTPSKQDGFNLNVVNVVIEKPLDEGTWSAGYKVDLLYGPNAVGFNNSVGSATSDLGIKQAYVALRAPLWNGFDIKIGSFDTIIGYEVFNAGSNPNYTRSWGYTMEPTEHTGILGSYQFTKNIGASFGIANTSVAGINRRTGRTDNEGSKTYMGSITLTAPDSWGSLAGSGLYLGIVDGFGGLNDQTTYYVGTTLTTPWKALKVGASYDYVVQHDNNFGPAGYSQALGLYASVQAREHLSFHVRAEWADFTDGNATGGRNNGLGGGGTGGIPAEVLSFTGTVQYDLWANVLSRLEVRWDHAISGHGPFGGTVAGASGPTTGGANEKNSVLIAANIIYKF